MTNLDEPVSPAFLAAQQMLAMSTRLQQIKILQEANLWHTAGLMSLLEVAAEWVRTNPGRARELTLICIDAASEADIDAVLPRAAYVQAQTHALAGEFEQARRLIEQARDGYEALGQSLPALRTTVGLMHVLGQAGRFQEALSAGQSVLDEIGDKAQPELAHLAALIRQNMGMCFSQIGRFDEALAAYDAAEASYLALEMDHQAGDIRNNRGVLLWEMGRGTEALAVLEDALAIRASAGQTMLQAQSLSNIGSAHLLLGNYSQSLSFFAQARDLFSSLGALVDQHVLLLDTANAYLTLNLYAEAEAAYREAESLLQTANAMPQRARALWGLGAALLAQKELNEAEEVLATAVSLLETITNTPTPLLATVLLEQAAIQAARAKWETAVTTAHYALAIVNEQDWPIPAIYAHLLLADLMHDDPPEVEAQLLAAQRLADSFRLPQIQFRLQQRLGRLRRLQGLHEEARQLLESAAADVEKSRGNLAQETIRTAFLHDKTAVYDELIQLYLAWENDEGKQLAFTVAERAKSRTLYDLISGVITVEPTAESAAAAQLTTLQADLNAIYNEMLSSGIGGTEGSLRTVQERAAELERAINQLRLRQAASDKVPESWIQPEPFSVIQAALPRDLTLLAYHVIEDDILVFVADRQSLGVQRMPDCASEVGQQLRRLDGLLDRMRVSSAFTTAQNSALELSVRRVLQRLYHLLFAPVESFLGKADMRAPQPLTIVPHGFLHQVPFHALFDGENYLIDRLAITYAPSSAIFLHCQQRPARKRNYALVVGVPDDSIPAVAAEVDAVTQYLPQAKVLLDEQATVQALQTSLEKCELLHLACHGLFRADNPMFSSLKLHDGWLTATDALRLNLQNALVTLSACESGRSHVMGGDEILGLIRAFLGAGAATVVVSLWLAQDETTAVLMARWYELLSQDDMEPAAALRAAQMSLKAEYPHPYYWAPFIVVGQR
ncbi:MAG: CHAT domain-containing protein [Anaerolineaceae bacterium]|nr:CHAT domain-containing protein [Anaerolineaceae bacterium]